MVIYQIYKSFAIKPDSVRVTYVQSLIHLYLYKMCALDSARRPTLHTSTYTEGEDLPHAGLEAYGLLLCFQSQRDSLYIHHTEPILSA